MKIEDLIRDWNLSRGEEFQNLTRDLFVAMAEWIVDLQKQIEKQNKRIQYLENLHERKQS
jgi:hypothetical protein